MHKPLFCFLLILFFIPAAATADITITAFCPDPYLTYDPDEYIVFSGQGSLDGWTVTDGEGTLSFPPGTRIHGGLVIARQAEAYRKTHGTYPDFEWEYSTPIVPTLPQSGRFILANTEDELELLYHGSERFSIAWPRDVKPREGQVHRIVDGVWNPRPFMIGQSDFSPIRIEGVSAMLFVSPDSSYEVVEDAIKSAEKSIEIGVYEFTHPGIGELLLDAHERGVSVRVLVEGSPVGGIAPEQAALLTVMNRTGIPVDLMRASGEIRSRYRFMHAKYLIIDSKSVLLASENLKESGIPFTGYEGNRGWGIWIHDTRVAEYFGCVYSEDAAGRDVVPITPAQAPGIPTAAAIPPRNSRFAPLWIDDAIIIPVISPDTSHLVPEMIAEATSTLEIQQAYISNWTNNAPNPWLDAAIDAARRGVNVRIILDASWFNIQGDFDNDEMAAFINRYAKTHDLPLEVRLFDADRAGITKIHTKGVIVDGNAVLVSSINWNENSPMNNREAGVIIRHPDAAAYYLRVFEEDWKNEYRRSQSTFALPSEEWPKPAIAIAILVFFAGIIIGKRIRRD
ncbi:phospholipase [Methanocalculus taiwanensis]|uniref:Phospholipase n=1 Tax=Methanocalculus taiwanensis TaxID=106207 RepID=A0ABD4TKZ3_9EURY|nr:phospholipase D-like domain-containing protein [Methanocalculus taiwanensis]MCQ1539431.1 phospholipase [Methanocalculus taiwanensis]